MPGSQFALSLIDALANAEETVVSAVAWALDGIPLVGGSAGDDLAFAGTVLVHDGAIHTNAAVLILVETDFPIRIFKSDNFVPTQRKFVVTAASEESRRVYELNAEPAAREYAKAVGLDPEHLTPMSFAAYPLAVKVGGEYYCRSISRVEPDGSLTLFCAISEGAVLTLAEPQDIVEATRAELSQLDETLGGLDLVIGFDCVLRRLDAESRQVRHRISDLYSRYGVVGFETYGEQYRSMHLNQTFTGIAIGRNHRRDRGARSVGARRGRDRPGHRVPRPAGGQAGADQRRPDGPCRAHDGPAGRRLRPVPDRDHARRPGPLPHGGADLADEEPGDLQHALKAAKEEAETANRSKTRFLAAASHDLLQPSTPHDSPSRRSPTSPPARRRRPWRGRSSAGSRPSRT